MSWLNKVGNGLNQVASAAAAGASAAGNAVQQGAATVKASAAASVEPKGQSSPQRWLIEVTPNPERQTLDLKLVDSKKKNKNSKGRADEGNESWAIAWPPTVSLTVVHRHYSMGIPPTQVADRESLGELQQVQNSASASDGTSMFTCSYGPVRESLLLESATKAAAANLDNGASYLPHEVFHELKCAVSVECVESLTIPAIVSGTIDVAAEAFDFEFQEGSDFEPEFDPLPTESIINNPLSLAPETISIGESAGFVALVSKAFKLEDARPILQVMPDQIRNALCLSILGTDPKSVAWPDTVVLGPRGMNLGGMAAKATAGHTRLSQSMDQKNAYTISPSDISAFPGKKPTVTVTASLTMPGGSTWTVESNLCSPAAAAPRLRVTPDPSDTCLVLSIDKIPCGTSVIFPDSISLAYGARRRTVQLSVHNTGSASAGGSQRYPVTPDVIQSAKSSVGAKHTVQVTAVIISGVEWSKLESNYFCLSDVRPKLQMIPCPRTRLLRLSILGVPHDQIKWPDNVSLKYIKIRHNGAHLSHNAMDIGQANNDSYPDEATFGPITDEILNEVDCRP